MASTSWILHTLWPVVIKCDCFVSSQVGTIFVNSGKHVYWQLLNNNMLYYGINNKISRGIISLISLKATLTFLKHFYWSKLHAICSYNERWDFSNAGSSLFLPRFSLLTFLRFLGPFFIFSEIFTSGFL